MSSRALIEFRRGADDLVETRHLGTVIVADVTGTVRWHAGDPERRCALRSTAKPFQLLPFVLDGLHESLDAADLAVLMSSHSGEPMHTTRIAALLERFDLSPRELRCGAHAPTDAATRDALARAGVAPGPLHCNCSGKHAGMLAVCRRRGWPLESYLEVEHPLQQRIRAILATLAGEPGRSLRSSVDGCSLPTWWLGLASLARMFACLAEPAAAPDLEGRSPARELALLRDAGLASPEMIAGHTRLDTVLMRAFPGRVFAKSGAAGLYAMAVPAGAGVPEALGIAIKIDDGDPDGRIRGLVALEVLARIGLAPPTPGAALERLRTLAGRTARNFRGLDVGTYQPVFELEAPGPRSRSASG
ncbi:MAG: asparaginase [Gammaproteobacteria bacterium]|nr:asparaginase [Gammaproteobacteria bacterium]